MEKIGFGGGCHWCTEAIFQSVRGVNKVEQGWITPVGVTEAFSEAIVVHFETISLHTLIAIHLATHSCTADHSMRSKYRSAVYTYSHTQAIQASTAIAAWQNDYHEPIITQVLPFGAFRLNEQQFLNYYYSNPEKPFCKNVINPKLLQLMQQFPQATVNRPEHRP